MNTYVSRTIEPFLVSHLNEGQAIVIYGPRQVGKTTLARKLLTHYQPDQIAEYQTDDPAQAALFEPIVSKLAQLVVGKKVLFIDEAQSITNAGLVLKLLVDNFPEVQVVATGSSSFELSDKIKESMVGRALTTTLLPFSCEELAPSPKERQLFDFTRVLQFGSYPQVSLSDDLRARDIIKSITDSYLYKDILSLADTRNPEVLRKLLTALALQVGQEVSYNELATMLEVSRTTIERYLYLLEQCFVIFRLHPLSSNPRKLLASRKRKVYFYDLGVRSALAGQLAIEPALNNQIGNIFENYCILERLKIRLNHQLSANTYYWRSPDSEVDYLEQSGTTTYAYEMKWSARSVSAPSRFKEQFPGAPFTVVSRDTFWDFIDTRHDDNEIQQKETTI